MASPTRETLRRNYRPHRNGHWRENRKRFDDMVDEAGEQVGEYASDVADRTGEYIDSGKHYVAGNPIKSLSIAAGIGVLVGMLLLALRPTRH